MRLDQALVLAAALCAAQAYAQLMPADPDWREVEAPPPPAVNTEGLIPLDIRGAALRFGIAPASVTLDSDGVVRYVVVATSTSGVVNALYEGLRCSTGEYKVYARHNPGSGWVISKDAQWQSVQDAALFRHALTIARSGACVGHAPNASASRIVRDLRSPLARYDQPQ